jgi:Family of unknown function (DUF5995)
MKKRASRAAASAGAAAIIVWGGAFNGQSAARDPGPNGDDKGLSDSPQCRAGQIGCVTQVILEMNRRFRALARACDHDAIFSLVYLRTTQVYRETAESIGYADVASVTREDALFADYYLRAFDAYHALSGSVPPAWQIAFDTAAARTLSAQGNAFLGVSAHIQRDLPFVLYDLYTRGDAVSHDDHTLVNSFLAQLDVAPEIIARFDPTYPLGSDITLIAAWREAAWQNFERLRDADPVQRVVIAAEIEYAAAAAGAAIAASLAYPPGSDSTERDAYCEAAR